MLLIYLYSLTFYRFKICIQRKKKFIVIVSWWFVWLFVQVHITRKSYKVWRLSLFISIQTITCYKQKTLHYRTLNIHTYKCINIEEFKPCIFDNLGETKKLICPALYKLYCGLFTEIFSTTKIKNPLKGGDFIPCIPHSKTSRSIICLLLRCFWL